MTIQPSRREFLGALSAFSLFPLEEEKPDLILHNANIYTMNPKEPRAQAVAVSRGRIIGIGSNPDVLNLASAGSKKIDVGMKTGVAGVFDGTPPPPMAWREGLG